MTKTPSRRLTVGFFRSAIAGLLALFVSTAALHAALPTLTSVYSSTTGDGLPTSQGWAASNTGTGTGSLITDLGVAAWNANGAGGRAQWQYIPTTQNNSDATTYGWTMTTVCRVVSGGYLTNYYSNGTKRFLPILSINANGDLIAALEGGSTYTLVATTGAAAYHSFTVSFSASAGTATFSFDGTAIATWAGSSSTQNCVVFGNGSSSTHGVANYDSVSFQILGGTTLFTSSVFTGGSEGTNGTAVYRIPTITTAPDGSLVAFAEGRQNSSDPGNGYPINISTKRSTDRGRSWSTIKVLASSASYAYSDPRTFVDTLHGKIFLFYTQWPLSAGLTTVPLMPLCSNLSAS